MSSNHLNATNLSQNIASSPHDDPFPVASFSRKPLPVANIEKLIKHIELNFSNEPNTALAIKILKCFLYLNDYSYHIAYSIQHKSDKANRKIYKDQRDADNYVLRSNEGLSFHLLSYNDATSAYKDYDQIISFFDSKADSLIQDGNKCKTFIMLVNDSDVGCLEARIKNVLPYLTDSSVLNLDDLFQLFLNEYPNPKAIEIITWFQEHIGKLVTYDKSDQLLSWNIIKSYLKYKMGFSDEDLKLPIEALDPKLKSNSIQTRNHSKLFFYESKKVAEFQLNKLKYTLSEFYPDLEKNASVLEVLTNNPVLYRFRVFNHQYDAFIHIQESEKMIKRSDRYKDWIVKTLRFDELCGLDIFRQSITHTEDKVTQPRIELRRGSHSQYTTYASGIFERNQKPNPYITGQFKPFTYDEIKKMSRYLSRHQSTSLITGKAQIPVFGHGTVRKEALVGVMLDPETCLFNRFFVYDTGTVDRPYEHNNLVSANDYYKRVTQNSILFDNYAKFKDHIEKTAAFGQHNEVLAKIRWDIKTSRVAIFTNTFESRCIAQIYAREIKSAIESKKDKLPDYHAYTGHIPICYYIPNDPLNFTEYTEAQQLNDVNYANLLLRDSLKSEREKLFSNQQYAFLLLATDPKLALSITYNSKSIIMHLIEQKQFHVFNLLIKRAGYDSPFDCISKREMKKARAEIAKQGNHVRYLCTASRMDILGLMMKIEPNLPTLALSDRQGENLLQYCVRMSYFNQMKQMIVSSPTKENLNAFISSFQYIPTALRYLEETLHLTQNKSSLVSDFVNAFTSQNTPVLNTFIKSMLFRQNKPTTNNIALCTAIYYSNTDVLNYVMNNLKHDINASAGGIHLIFYAVLSKNEDIVKLLLDHGAKLDVKSSYPNSGDGALAKITQGSTPELGDSPLHLACRMYKSGNNEEALAIAKLLIHRGADHDARNNSNDLPIHLVSQNSKLAAIFRFMKYRDATNERDDNDYKKYVLFGRYFPVGYSAKSKKEGVSVVYNSLFVNRDNRGLRRYHDVIHNGQFEKIYNDLGM